MIRGIPALSVISCPHEILVNMPVIKFQLQVCAWPCLKHLSDPTEKPALILSTLFVNK